MVQLLDLPAEILREILVCAVTVRHLNRGLRLRLVNRKLTCYPKVAICKELYNRRSIAIKLLEDNRPPPTRICLSTSLGWNA